MFLYNKVRQMMRKYPPLMNLVKRAIPKKYLVRITKSLYKPKKEIRNGQMLLIVCNDGFNQNFPSAASLMRVGFARGWAQKIGPAKLVSIYDLVREIGLYDKPAVFISAYEFNNLTLNDCKKLRNTDLFVWIGVHPKKIKKFSSLVLKNSFAYDRPFLLSAYSKIITAEPKFLWNSTGEKTMYWYEDWIKDGFKWETMHPAVDPERYYPDLNKKKFGHIKMAYVGGYWPEKAQAFDLYFRKWEKIFVPYGYETWPYKNYGGQLTEKEERQLYSSSQLIPLVTTPAGWLIGEITERYLKAPACKAFCIADENSTLREIFKENEMIQAKNSEHFHQLINDFLKNKIDKENWIKKAYLAVKERHLYSHRAIQIKNALKK